MDRHAKKSANKVNEALHTLGLTYHESLPIAKISEILEDNGFNSENLEGVYCGRDSYADAYVNCGAYLRISWYKMPSGRYEVTSYLS